MQYFFYIYVTHNISKLLNSINIIVIEIILCIHKYAPMADDILLHRYSATLIMCCMKIKCEIDQSYR